MEPFNLPRFPRSHQPWGWHKQSSALSPRHQSSFWTDGLLWSLGREPSTRDNFRLHPVSSGTKKTMFNWSNLYPVRATHLVFSQYFNARSQIQQRLINVAWKIRKKYIVNILFLLNKYTEIVAFPWPTCFTYTCAFCPGPTSPLTSCQVHQAQLTNSHLIFILTRQTLVLVFINSPNIYLKRTLGLQIWLKFQQTWRMLSPSASRGAWASLMMKTLWERLDSLFRQVFATFLFFWPTTMNNRKALSFISFPTSGT